jgi:hypothetical protein
VLGKLHFGSGSENLGNAVFECMDCQLLVVECLAPVCVGGHVGGAKRVKCAS